MRTRQLAWQGIQLSYDEAGIGPPILLLHGGAANARAWTRVAECLQSRFRTIVPDLPGYGGSSAQPVHLPPSPRHYASMLVEFLGPSSEPLTVVGHSTGGGVAFALALAGAPIDRLILVEPGIMCALKAAGEQDVHDWSVERYVGRVIPLGRSGDPLAPALMIDGWCGEGAFARLPEKVQSYLQTQMRAATYDIEGAFADTYTPEQFAEVTVPTLVLAGAAGTEMPRALARSLGRLLPRCEVQVIPGADHNMIATHAEDVAQRILKFTGRS